MIPHAFDCIDLHPRIFSQVIPQFGDVHIQIPGVEKAVVAPNAHQDVFSGNGEIAVFAQNGEEFGFAVGKFARLFAAAEFVAVR